MQVVLLAFILLFFSSAIARDDIDLEYKLKAAFTFNFIKFIEWPKESLQSGNPEFTLSILGSGPINDALLELEGKSVFGKKLHIREVDDIPEAKGSEAMFINSSKESQLEEIMKQTRKMKMLTIGEMDEFCEQGGMINFVIEDDSIQFEINLKEARRSSFVISYKLLNQASKIYE